MRKAGCLFLVLLCLFVRPSLAEAQNAPERTRGRGDFAADRPAGDHQSPDATWLRHHRGAFHPGHFRRQSFWFQRPYPYHLDYYRLRYQGSYAPYFGNLYGPPAVQYGYLAPPGYYADPAAAPPSRPFDGAYYW